jgi:predicted dienelactone hydrolase
VLLGVGLGAARAAYFLHSNPSTDSPPAFAALVVINPQMGIPETPAFVFTESLAKMTLPVLDIAFATHPSAPTSAPARKAAAKQHRLPAYEQRLILEPEGSDAGENRLSRLVRGFLLKRHPGASRH